MDWGTLVATASGAVIAIAGTVLADQLRGRRGHPRRARAAVHRRHRDGRLWSSAGTVGTATTAASSAGRLLAAPDRGRSTPRGERQAAT